jgi:hypothetical protein
MRKGGTQKTFLQLIAGGRLSPGLPHLGTISTLQINEVKTSGVEMWEGENFSERELRYKIMR